MIYKILTDSMKTGYSIAAVDEDTNIIYQGYSDISLAYEVVAQFVYNLNSNQLPLVHFYSVLEDFLYENKCIERA